MQPRKNASISSSEPIGSDQTQEKVQDPAKEAGLARNRFYQTDKWVVGVDGAKSYVVPKNTLPQPLAKAFVHSTKPDPVTDRITYDERKFNLDEWPHSEFPGGRVAITLREPLASIADVIFQKNTFVITLFEVPKSGAFPFNQDEFLKAVHAAKWQLELYCMPDLESDSGES